MGDTYIPGFASATLQVVLDRLWDFMVREVGLLLDANDGFKKLERTLLRVQAMLDDVEQKEISHKAWKIWVRDLKDAAYEADELLDEIAIASSCTSSQQVNMSSFPSFKPHKMDSIQKKVDDIAREMEFLYVSKLVGSSQNRTTQRPPSASILLADERSFFGRDNERTMMINSLLSREGEVVGGMENVSIVSVVGMAGIGKTTLAQIVYNDPQIRDGFDSRMWVSVNNDFDVKRITKSIIESFTHEVINLIDLDSLQVTLESLLAGKKFLLVLDDMWNESYHDWDVLQAPFRVGAPGSKILITTRSQVASKILIPSCIISLQSLSIEDSWLLFRSRAFGNRDPAEIPPNLISIGMEIVRKSKGLPLVAKTLGSLLNSVVDEEQWNTISRSEIWDFQEDESNILSALKLSYQYLPSHLKQCFAYCAIFPKGYKFEKEKIVLLWMAQGFLPAKGGRRMEDVGSDWFNSLISRSFFQEQPSGPGGRPIYLMHDLIQDLAKFVSGEECFGMEASDDSGQPYISRNVRHLSFLKGKVSASTYEALCRSQSIRTILLSSELSYSIHDVPFKIFARLNCLRVLDLSLTRIEELPSSIGNLKHLRYLDLSMTKIKTLHKNLCSLCSLQTLKLVGCTELLGLPQGLSNLTNLRHLDLQSNVRITSMPQSIGKLTDLQTLSTFIAGVENGCQIGELKNLRNLRGTLCISNLENVGNMEQANQAGVRHKQHLRKLKLVWRSESNGDTVLAGLRPHSNMEELHVVYYNGAVFPGWIADSLLVNLVAITLENCRKCVFLPPLGQLPALKSLVITNMPSVEYIDESFCGVGEVMGFPSLETLELDNMQNFLRWDGLAEGNIPRLQKLHISSCIKLEAVPNILCFTTLENFEVSHCPEVQVLPKEDVPSSLKCLIVNSCSLLRRWYESEGSGDLQVIAHNREVTIDGFRIS